ncbi:MAG TPA: glutamate--tRNA ligase [Anaerolineae bacterium]|nr:glutamate--tRNA ligase [Anaerolineae bacterium]
MTEKPVRVRIAPSPTGYFHVGSARTALFNWLFAHHHGGHFIVRIEDTDRNRYNPDAVQDCIDSLRWLGLEWDEGPEAGGDYGPYHQSDRLDLYRTYALQLVAQGQAYPCYCSQERVDALREQQRLNKQDVGYDRHCRRLTAAQRAEQEAQGIVPVIRLAAPLEGQTTFHDVLYGTISVDNRTLDDLVLLKSDGFPTYHLANVVDDHLMEISHIMRGDEWLSSVPKHVLLYNAFGWEIPVYAHLPLILAPTGQGKLSKRHGGVEIREFRRQGYLPEAMINYLARVGWSYDDKTEILSRDELVRAFDLPGINHSPARFSYDRLEWMNGYYIRQLDPADLAARLVPYLAEAGIAATAEQLLPIVPLIRERLKTLGDVVPWADFFFVEPSPDPGLLAGKKLDAAAAKAVLLRAGEVLSALPDLRPETTEPALRALAAELGLGDGPLFGVLRVALTGKAVAPPLFDTITILGRARVLSRLANAAGTL